MPVSQVLPCLDQRDVSACLVRILIALDGDAFVRFEPRYSSDPAFARSVGVDLDSASDSNLRSGDVVRLVLAADRGGVPPDEALKPLDEALGDQRYTFINFGYQEIVRLWLTAPAHLKPSLGLRDATLARMESYVSRDHPNVADAYAEDLARLYLMLGETAKAQRLYAFREAQGIPLARPEFTRAKGLLQRGQYVEAADAALALERVPAGAQWDMNIEVISVRRQVMEWSEQDGRPDVALKVARALIAEDLSGRFRLDSWPPYEDAVPILVRQAPAAETARVLTQLEGRIRGDAEDAPRAAEAAFIGWTALGRPDAAARVLTAYLPIAAAEDASPNQRGLPFKRRIAADLLIRSGRLDEAWTMGLAKAEDLLDTDIYSERDAAHLSDWLVRLPSDAERFEFLRYCAGRIQRINLTVEAQRGCLDRLAVAAKTPDQKAQAAETLVLATYDVFSSHEAVLKPEKVALAAKLWREAIAQKPAIAEVPIRVRDLYAIARALRPGWSAPPTPREIY